MERILMLHGLNHDQMGKGEGSVHGAVTMEDLDQLVGKTAAALGVEVDSYQNNEEKEVIRRIETAEAEHYAGILFNPADWMDTGSGIAEALAKLMIPVMEIHISNVDKRADRTNVIAPSVTGLLTGFGVKVYSYGLRILAAEIRKE